jgi:dual specificity protein phosphatase-like protein
MNVDPQAVNISADQIIKNIWIGNQAASQSKQFMKNNNIDVIINCTKHIPFVDLPLIKLRVPINDPGVNAPLDQEDVSLMLNYLPRVTKFINNHYKNDQNIFIHCHAGMQRSAAICAAFLARFIFYPTLARSPHIDTTFFRRESMDRAIRLIQVMRPVAFSRGQSINFKNALNRFLEI